MRFVFAMILITNWECRPTIIKFIIFIHHRFASHVSISARRYLRIRPTTNGRGNFGFATSRLTVVCETFQRVARSAIVRMSSGMADRYVFCQVNDARSQSISLCMRSAMTSSASPLPI